MSGRLKGKLALVTGSTQGLGAGIARSFVAEGARVVVTGRNEERGRKVAKSIGHGTVFIPADLVDPDEVRRLAAEALKALGGLDILVNSAAMPERSNLDTFTADQFDRLFHCDVLAPLLLAQAARKALAARTGTIINIGSVNAYMGDGNLLVYSSTKGALVTATRNLAAALQYDRIRVHVLNCGWMDTEGERAIMSGEGHPPNFLDEAGQFRPMGRLITPAEVAGACVWLASDEAAVFSGTVIDLEQHPVGAWGRRRKKEEKKP